MEPLERAALAQRSEARAGQTAAGAAAARSGGLRVARRGVGLSRPGGSSGAEQTVTPCATVLRTGEQQTTSETSDTSFKRTTQQSDYDELDTYDMSKNRVAFLMCVTTGRHGAERDIEVMNKWFDVYQFEMPSGQCIDPNGQEILPALEEFRDQINQSEDEISCCLIVLMSHGRNHNLIQGKDGDTVDLDDIFALFNNVQCPKLQEKPKIFIIQACRGGEEDHGVEEIEDKFMEADCIYNLIAIRRLPTASDYYVVYSTQKGYVSLRNKKKGSRMIEAIDEVFSEHGRKRHIGDLFTEMGRPHPYTVFQMWTYHGFM
ncbi:caspase-14-like isoform X2 [Carettochelys insculpta]|uniref:caspase-14-like isoform X2 n=1 Tax=Carettochelys insculpta TaxID=44489 RepID=UPI003EBE175F